METMKEDIDLGIFQQELQKLGLDAGPDQIRQLQEFKILLSDWGRVHNLTTVEAPDFYRRHVLNSLGVVRFPAWRSAVSLIDIGSGAGFPGIVLKIFFPDLRLTLVEAVEKKTLFLESVAYKLGLKDVEVCARRAEDLGQMSEYRERFDLATSRALAHLQIAAELCLPFVRVGGYFLAFKGQKAEEELEQSRERLTEFACSCEQILNYQEDSHIMVIKKASSTPAQYPRSSAAIRRTQKQLLDNIK